MIKIIPLAAVAALLTAPAALAQDVSAGGRVMDESDLGRLESRIDVLEEQRRQDEAQINQRQAGEDQGDDGSILRDQTAEMPEAGQAEGETGFDQDQTAEIPGEEGEAAGIPGRQDEPVTGSNLGQTDRLDTAVEGALPAIPEDDDQTAALPDLEDQINEDAGAAEDQAEQETVGEEALIRRTDEGAQSDPGQRDTMTR